MLIEHNQQTQRFYVLIDGVTAYLSYEVLLDGVLDYQHTIVPSALGGQGIGKALVKHTLDYARDNGKKVRPSCSFIASFIAKNPQYADLVA